MYLSPLQKVAEESEDTPLVAIGAEQADTGRDRYELPPFSPGTE
jgi:hypothetical protein